MGSALGRAGRISEWVFPAVPPSYDESHKLLVRIPVYAAGTEAPALLLGRDVIPDDQLHCLGHHVSTCIIYFHSNGCDIGQCIEDVCTLRDGVLDGDAVALCPEYPGYGLLREFEPSVAGIDLVADAAWRYCVQDLGFKPAQIMVCGRSIGTGPATQLVHRRALEARLTVEGGSDELPVMPPSSPTASVTGSWSPVARLGGGGASGPSFCQVGLPSSPGAPERPEALDGASPDGTWRLGGEPKGSAADADAGAGPILRVALGEEVGSPIAGPGLDCNKGADLHPRTVERPQVGYAVTVLQDLYSDSTGRALMRRGEKGVVLRVDECGDTLIDFKVHDKSQWVFTSNHHKLMFVVPFRPVGALVLIAPLISVSAVIQDHVASELAASLVGPMWSVLEMVKDPAMEDVPLFILHPKDDEIVPSKHGQTVFEQATCRSKFGVWLCNATHNICIEEDHLRLARLYFRDLRQRAEHFTGFWKGAIRGEDGLLPVGASGDSLVDLEIMAVATELIKIGADDKAEDMVMMTL